MEWFRTLLFSEGIAHTILLYSLAIWLGVLLGKVKIVGISLGPTFVLFVGLFIGHLGFTVNHEVAEFVREFGLILFIYSIGLQVGPGFFSSFKRGGMQLNLMAAGIVLLGVGVTILLFYLLNGRVSMPMLVGVMSGAVTNTPGLGAAQEALKQAFEAGQLAEIPQIALGYAVAYPLAVVGIILSMVVIRLMFRINIEQEEQALEASGEVQADKPEIMTLRLTNKALSGRKLHEIKDLVGRSFVISRMMRQGHYSIPRMDSILQEGDLLLVITATADVEPVTVFMGEKVEMDWEASEKQLVSRRIVITRSEINGKTLGSLRLRTLYGVNITRVHRSGVDLLGNPNLVLQVGDRVMVVGELGDGGRAE